VRTGLLAAIALIASTLATSAAAPAAGAAGTILDEQVAVVTGQHQLVISAAQLRVGGARAALAAALARQSSDQALVAQAATRAASAATAVTTDQATLTADTAARDAATAAATDDRSRLRAIGVELYVGPQVTPIDGPDSLAKAQQEIFATEVIDIGAGALITDLHIRAADRQKAVKAIGADTRLLSADRATLADASALRDHRTVLLAADASAVSAATTTAAQTQSQLSADTAALTAAVAGLANPTGAPADGSPTIVGPAALTAAELVRWFDSQGFSDLTPAPIEQLAGWYLGEGAAEGVRGDVAFAQATVETGGFASSDAITQNNYAGIGHCDSCNAGLAFGSPQLGVRGQIQLLHSFADGGLTTAQLASPLAMASLNPATQPDRGCCSTWQSLTGKWATDPSYGSTLMRVYRSMLDSAVAQL
jgi:hypothetical protein